MDWLVLIIIFLVVAMIWGSRYGVFFEKGEQRHKEKKNHTEHVNAIQLSEDLIKQKQAVFEGIEKDIERFLNGYQRKEVIVECPDELFEEVRKEFQAKGYRVWREECEYTDWEGSFMGDWGYDTYVGKC